MIRCAILVKDRAFGLAWSQYLIEVHHFLAEEIALWCVNSSPSTDGIEEFRALIGWLDNQLEASIWKSTGSSLLVMTDFDGEYLSGFDKLNPLTRIADWRRVLGMLILALPEVQWVLAGSSLKSQRLLDAGWWPEPHIPVIPGVGSNISTQSAQGAKASSFTLHRAGYLPLFDGSGLRSCIRQAIGSATSKQFNIPELPLRNCGAAAIDDESTYTLLHAYTAYRFGFRSIPVGTAMLARRLFGVTSQEAVKIDQFGPKLEVIFEDVFLDFPDGSQGLSRLFDERRKLLPGIENIRYRVFVTSGQRQRGDQSKAAANLRYLNEQRALGKHIVSLNKPHPGIFRLWENAGLFRKLRRIVDGRRYRGLGEGYRWPPRKAFDDAKEHTHSAPGVLQVISQTLIQRAQRIRKDANSVKDAVTGAVLATDALELLAGRTPTTSIDALSLKHELEVIAECKFSGGEFQHGLTPRFNEIHRDVEVISRSFHPAHRTNAALNAETRIISKLLLIFRENAQYEEEQACINRVRHLRNTLWMRRRPIRYIFWLIVRYVELLLASFTQFLLVLLCWIVVLSALYTYAGAHEYWYWGVEDAITSFFSIGEPINENQQAPHSLGYITVVCLAIVAGFIHLGIFISHLYSLVARK